MSNSLKIIALGNAHSSTTFTNCQVVEEELHEHPAIHREPFAIIGRMFTGEDEYVDDKDIPNYKKHAETCAKNRKKRKKRTKNKRK